MYIHLYKCMYMYIHVHESMYKYKHVCTMFSSVLTYLPYPVQVVRIPDDGKHVMPCNYMPLHDYYMSCNGKGQHVM